MHLRALIVLLIVMNLGVALWWALRPAADPEPAPERPADVPRLLLVSEAEAGMLEMAALNAANANVEADGPLADSRGGTAAGRLDFEGLDCFSFGPWTDAAEAQAGLAALRPQATFASEREAPTGASGWRVMLPPQADRDAAHATVARLVEAGFNDHFIIAQGDEANSIALGRFGAGATARRHEAALREAGFEAVAEPLDATGTETWIDLAAGEGFDPDAAREAAGAAGADPIDCARLQ